MRRVCRRCSSVADFTRPALLRVDLRDGLVGFETSNAGPPLFVDRLDKLRCAVPSPLTPAVAAPTLRSLVRARTFLGLGGLLLICCSARNRSALVAMRFTIRRCFGNARTSAALNRRSLNGVRVEDCWVSGRGTLSTAHSSQRGRSRHVPPKAVTQITALRDHQPDDAFITVAEHAPMNPRRPTMQCARCFSRGSLLLPRGVASENRVRILRVLATSSSAQDEPSRPVNV